MTDPYMPPGRAYAVDTYARQLAMEALQRANTASGVVAQLTPSVGGPVTVPALSLGASVQVVIPFTPEIAGNYVPIPTLVAAPTLLLGLSLVGVAAKATNSVTVTVRAATLAVAAGATVSVVCFKTA